MLGFLLRRLGFGLVALFLGLTASFFYFTAHDHPANEAGQPLLPAYWVWLRGVPSFHSFDRGMFGGPLLSEIGSAFGRTLLLLLVTLVVVLAVAIPLGCLAAAKRGTIVDFALRCLSYATWAVPSFLMATVLQEALGRIPGGWGLAWFPYIGWAGECPNGQGIDNHTFQCPSGGTGLNHVGLVLDHLAIPAIALALGFIGLHARYLRSALLDALDAPHIAVARGKGLTERALLFRHGVRNALVTFVPAVVSDFGMIFGAALAVDYIFQLGGIGQFFIGSLHLDAGGFVPVDTNSEQLLLLLGGGLMILASVLGEVSLWFLDPRTRPD
jgi:ABC-type dipeptide/oligopeptide/nickel transport system permease component